MIISQQNIRPFRALFSLLAILLFASVLFVQTLSAETRYRVKSSDNVNTIVQRQYPNSGLSKGQLLIGILIKNPRAFKGGNVNFLLRGRRLVLPNKSFFRQISPEKASEVLSEHVRYFRFGITGGLPAPTLAEMKKEPDVFNSSGDILEKQRNQTKKIDKLQQESNELKRQLEILINEKNNRDQRLIELEKSLKITRNSGEGLFESKLKGSIKKLKKEELFIPSQQRSVKEEQEFTKNEQVKQEATSQQENRAALGEPVKISNDDNKQIILDSTSNNFSKIIWLLPLVLLGLLVIYLKRKKKKEVLNDTVKINEAGYIETAGNSFVDLQKTDEEYEESSLETSVKLDVARAYIEAEDTESALDILTEIIEEGSDEQKQQAHDLLETISFR